MLSNADILLIQRAIPDHINIQAAEQIKTSRPNSIVIFDVRSREVNLSGDLLKNIDYLAVQDEKDINLVLESVKLERPDNSSVFEMDDNITSKIKAIIELYPSIKILFKHK